MTPATNRRSLPSMRHVDPINAAADAIPADPVLADLPGAARDLVERQMAVLAELAEIGMRNWGTG